MNTFRCSQPSSDELDLPPHCFFCSNEIGDFYPLTINKALSSKYCNSQASIEQEFIEALLQDAYIPERVMLQQLQVWQDDTQNLKRVYASSQFQGKIKKISQFYSKTWDAPRIHGLPESKVYSNRIVCKREFQYRKANNLPLNYSSDDSEMHYPSRDRYSTILKSIKDLSFKTVRKQQKKDRKPKLSMQKPKEKKVLNESQACQDLLDRLKNLTSHRIKTPVQFEVLRQSSNQKIRLDKIIEDFNKNQLKNLINLKLNNLRRNSKEKDSKFDFKKKDPGDYSHRKLSNFKTKQSHDKLQESRTKIHKVQVQRKSNNILILTGNGKISNKVDLIKGLHTNIQTTTDRTKRSASIKFLSKNKESSIQKIERLHKIYDSPGKLSKVNTGNRHLSQPKLVSSRPDKGFSDSKLMSNRTRSISKKGLSAQKR